MSKEPELQVDITLTQTEVNFILNNLKSIDNPTVKYNKDYTVMLKNMIEENSDCAKNILKLLKDKSDLFKE
jgi:hypothetical protein